MNQPSTKSATLDHKFSGWSLWLEPCSHETSEIRNEMKKLTQLCGGIKSSPPFELHCTLLYNFDPPHHLTDQTEKEEYGNQLLTKCWNLYNERSNGGDDCASNRILLNPTSYYYFPYPKEADGGKGFGCVISLMILEKTQELSCLHQAALQTFPPDERHCNKNEQSNVVSTRQEEVATNDDNCAERNKKKVVNVEVDQTEAGKFIPHMALVYAPEIYGEALKSKTEELTKEKSQSLRPYMGKYLSLWSTEGEIKDWYVIARLTLP